MMARETIYGALFAKLQKLLVANGGLFITVSRRLTSVTGIPPEAQPAIYQVQTRETPAVKRGLPTRWNLKVELWISVWQTSQSAPSSSILNPLLDAVEALFLPDNPVANDCTLGGLVSHCRIEGRDIEIYEGVTTGTSGTQAIAIVPIDIMTA